MKFTDEQVEYIKRVSAIKRRLAARLNKLPTNAEMAEKIGASERYVERIAAGHSRVVPRGTPVTPAQIAQLADALRD
jgi:DNA-directed RNA polymerase sigma subunit (sigma70/sigma32)